MEDDEAHLGDVGGDEEHQGTLDGQRQAVVQLAQSPVEGKARNAAEEQRRGVDEVRREVQHLALDRLALRHHVFDVLQVAPGPEVDKVEAEHDEGGLEELEQHATLVPIFFFCLRCAGARYRCIYKTYHREAGEGIVNAQPLHAPPRDEPQDHDDEGEYADEEEGNLGGQVALLREQIKGDARRHGAGLNGCRDICVDGHGEGKPRASSVQLRRRGLTGRPQAGDMPEVFRPSVEGSRAQRRERRRWRERREGELETVPRIYSKGEVSAVVVVRGSCK